MLPAPMANLSASRLPLPPNPHTRLQLLRVMEEPTLPPLFRSRRFSSRLIR